MCLEDGSYHVIHQVQFEGDCICAVAAETRELAKRAVRAIKVQYEDLKPVITIEVECNYYLLIHLQLTNTKKNHDTRGTCLGSE